MRLIEAEEEVVGKPPNLWKIKDLEQVRDWWKLLMIGGAKYDPNEEKISVKMCEKNIEEVAKRIERASGVLVN